MQLSMPSARSALGALVLVTVAASLAPTIARAAVQRAVVEPEAAPVGAVISIHVETTSRFGGVAPGTIYLIPVAAEQSTPDAAHCDAIPGTIALGDMTWRSGLVEFGVGVYEGFIGDAAFEVPASPPGRYHIGEASPAINEGCHMYAIFTISDPAVPNTAMARVPVPRVTEPTLLAAAVLAALATSVVASARAARRCRA
jgi:hypothetical protein